MLDLVFGTYKRTDKEWVDVNDARYKKEMVALGVVSMLVFPKFISSSHHIVSKNLAKHPKHCSFQAEECVRCTAVAFLSSQIFREETTSNGDIVIHMKVPDFIDLHVLSLWSNPAKSSRVNAGRMIVDPDKIGRWDST